MGRIGTGRMWAALLLAGLTPVLAGGLGRTGQVEQRLLAAHNRERAALGVAPLAWDAELAGQAAAWGQSLAARGLLQHAPRGRGEPQGENLWAGTQGAYIPEAMVDAWARERALYTHAPFPAVSQTGRWKDVGHYTQMVWRQSDRVGCAVAAGEDFDVLVCRYRSAGNVTGQRAF